MSDDEIRVAERRWKATGSAEDGEAYVQTVVRATGAPVLPMISMLIQQARALRALAVGPGTPAERLSRGITEALRRTVTPDDMVDFLRGEGEWHRGSQPTPTIAQDLATLGLVDNGILPASAVLCNHSADYTCGRCDPSIDPTDPNANVPRRPSRIGDAIMCEHANEVPNRCPCPVGCYCRQNGNTCSDVTHVHAMSDRECQFCNLDALWCFKTLGGPYVCDMHLVAERARRFRGELGEVQRLNAWSRTADDHTLCCWPHCGRGSVWLRDEEGVLAFYCHEHHIMAAEATVAEVGGYDLCNCNTYGGRTHTPRVGCV